MLQQGKVTILGISGSLRPSSSATAILKFAGQLMPSHVNFEIFDTIAAIPAFDDSKEIPLAVSDLINRITAADAVFFCIPEYAFGVPGALKNALDWTVSSIAFTGKPVALITAASQGQKAQTAFLFTLEALGCEVPQDCSLLVSFVRSKLDSNNQVKDPETLKEIKTVVHKIAERAARS